MKYKMLFCVAGMFVSMSAPSIAAEEHNWGGHINASSRGATFQQKQEFEAKHKKALDGIEGRAGMMRFRSYSGPGENLLPAYWNEYSGAAYNASRNKIYYFYRGTLSPEGVWHDFTFIESKDKN